MNQKKLKAYLFPSCLLGLKDNNDYKRILFSDILIRIKGQSCEPMLDNFFVRKPSRLVLNSIPWTFHDFMDAVEFVGWLKILCLGHSLLLRPLSPLSSPSCYVWCHHYRHHHHHHHGHHHHHHHHHRLKMLCVIPSSPSPPSSPPRTSSSSS